MTNQAISESTHAICATCKQVFKMEDLSGCYLCDEGRTCAQCVPTCCIGQVLESAGTKLEAM